MCNIYTKIQIKICRKDKGTDSSPSVVYECFSPVAFHYSAY